MDKISCRNKFRWAEVSRYAVRSGVRQKTNFSRDPIPTTLPPYRTVRFEYVSFLVEFVYIYSVSFLRSRV